MATEEVDQEVEDVATTTLKTEEAEYEPTPPPAKQLKQGLFLDTWFGTLTSTMSLDVSDIHGD